MAAFGFHPVTLGTFFHILWFGHYTVGYFIIIISKAGMNIFPI
jgi:hypothetical protein